MDTAKATRLQIARIWATAHELGLGREALYRLVPGGSISRLNRAQASDVITHLEAMRRDEAASEVRAPRPAAANAVTPDQLHFIHYLFGRLGWLSEPGHMANFLNKYFHVSRLEDLPDRRRASAVIESLKAILARRRQRVTRPAAAQDGATPKGAASQEPAPEKAEGLTPCS